MRRLITSHALAGTAVALPWPALLAAVWQTTDDPTLLGLAGAARFAPCVLLSAFLGGIGDRFGRFRTVRVVTALRLALLALVAVFLYAELPWAAVAAATLTVAAGVPAFPSLAALVPQVADDPERATDTLVTWEISAFVIGPALGGLLVGFGVSPRGLRVCCSSRRPSWCCPAGLVNNVRTTSGCSCGTGCARCWRCRWCAAPWPR